MSEQHTGRARVAGDRTTVALRQLAGPRMYRRNAFRITGLATDTGRRAVRERQRQVLPMVEAGADIELGHSLPVGPDEIRDAFDRLLTNPYARVVDEVLWLWGGTDSCGCRDTVHDDHDEAVRAHSAALDLAAEGDLSDAEPLWSTAAAMWGKSLRRAEFWDHVRARVEALDERQLDESTVDVLRRQLPITLLEPLFELLTTSGDEKGRLADRVRDWPGVPAGVVADRLEQAAAPWYDGAREALSDAAAQLDLGEPERAAAVVYERVMPQLDRLETVVPHDRHRRTAQLREQVALQLNNCAAKLIDSLGPRARDLGRKWLGTARDLAGDAPARATIDANLATLEEIVATFGVISRQVSELTARGRADLARVMLHDLKRQLRGGPGAAEIDRLLDGLKGGRRPEPAGSTVVRSPARPRTPSRPQTPSPRSAPHTGPRGRARKRRSPRWPTVVPVVVAIVFLVVAYLLASDGTDNATLFSSRVADNAPVGTCIETGLGDGGAALTDLPIVRCDRPHQAQIIAYPVLYQAGSAWPGDDAVHEAASSACRDATAGRSLPPDLRVRTDWPDRTWWDDSHNPIYAVCTVVRADGTQFTGGI